jgi:lactate dehydrogenase-like 2-hydroxyacid dehydrogenase
MTQPSIFVTRRIPDQGLELLRPVGEVVVWEDELPPPYEVLQREAARAEGLLCLLSDRIDAGLIRSLPRLRVISQMAVGVDNIDLPAATAARLPVGHTPGVLTETTADFAFALLMSAARRLPEGERWVQTGRWRTWGPTLLMGQDIHGATLGIVGLGRIGTAMARRAQGFGMRILYTDHAESPAAQELNAEFCPLDTLLAESDFISLHAPLTPETHHLIDARAFGLMKPSGVLINTARGPLVDPQALYDALSQHRIAAAALDVTEPEPIPPESPLLTLDNCLIVPHIASSSVATRTRMATMAAENLIAGLAGNPLPYCANPQVYAQG